MTARAKVAKDELAPGVVPHGSLLYRIGTYAVVALLWSTVVSLLLCRDYTMNEATRESQTATNAAAVSITNYLEDVDLDTVFRSGESEEYRDLVGDVEELCKGLGLKYLYLYVVNEARDTRTYRFVVGTEEENNDEDIDITTYIPTFGDTSVAPFSEQEYEALDGLAPKTYEIVRNQYGYLFSWYYPLFRSDGTVYGVIGADYDAGHMMRGVTDNTIAFAVPMIGILFANILLGLWLLKRRVLDPVRLVSKRMALFTEVGSGEPLKMKRDDEIGGIALAYNKMSDDIRRYVLELEKMTADRVASDTELSVARRIQDGLVPSSKEVSGNGFDAYAVANSARIVGGDFYDLVVIPDGDRVYVVMADVSGKGVSSALFMAMCKTLLREKIATSATMAEALNEANDAIVAENPEGLFVTVFAGIYDPHTQILSYANAGHTRPLLVGSGFEHPDPGIALGVFEDAGIIDQTLHIPTGSGVLLYTDGVTEAVGEDGSFYGEERLEKAVRSATNAHDTIDRVLTSLETFRGSREQFDDITMLALFALEDDATRWHATLPSDLASFAQVRDAILNLCGEGSDVKRAILACDEAFANVVMYSGATEVEVTCEHDGEVLWVTIADDGVAFDPLAQDSPDLEFEELDEGGMGLSFIAQIASSSSYERSVDRNVLKMGFNVA